MLTKPLLSQREPAQEQEVIDLQIDRWDRAVAAHNPWQEIGKLCTDFVEGNQWSDEDRKKLASEGRPAITLNKINPLRRMLIGYFRQNRYDVKYLPGSSGNDAGAKAITHVAKQIAEANQTPWNEAEVFNDGLVTARGYFDLRIDYTDNVFGDIKETALDPFSVYPDPESDSYDPAGWNYVMISRWMAWNDIQRVFGGGAASLVDTLGSNSTRSGMTGTGEGAEEVSPERWFVLENYLNGHGSLMRLPNRVGGPYDFIDRQRKLVRVIECQHRVLQPVRQFIDLQTGDKKTIPDTFDNERVRKVIEYWAYHGVQLDVIRGIEKKIRHTYTAADIVLYDDWSLDRSFTTIPFFAYFRRGKTRGFVDDLLDPQREINKRRSSMLHILATQSNSGWIWTRGSLNEEMVERVENEGARPGLHIEVESGFERPSRIEPAAPPANVERAEKVAAIDLKEISGINDSALGNLDRVQSGRAVIARQRQAIVGAEEFFDNFARSRELRARRLLEMIQTYYTEQRLIRVRGDGQGGAEYQDMIINQLTPEGRVINNVALGRYTVAIDEAPMSSTFADQEFDDLVTMTKELGIPIPPDIIVEASNVGRKREIVDRLRAAQGLQPAVPGAAPGVVPGGVPPAAPGVPASSAAPALSPPPNAIPIAPGIPQNRGM